MRVVSLVQQPVRRKGPPAPPATMVSGRLKGPERSESPHGNHHRRRQAETGVDPPNGEHGGPESGGPFARTTRGPPAGSDSTATRGMGDGACGSEIPVIVVGRLDAIDVANTEGKRSTGGSRTATTQ